MKINNENFNIKIEKLFNDLEISKKQSLVIHSSIYELYLLDQPQKKLWEFINKFIGDNVGLSFPTYCLYESTLYDTKKSRSSVGSFSEYLLRNQNGLRTICPIHNHLFFYEEKLSPHKLNFYQSFGQSTDFDYFYKNNYKLLLLANDFNMGCSYLHHLEYLANVPYREMIEVEKKIIDENGNEFKIIFNYFARKDKKSKTDFNKVENYIKNCVSFKKSKLSFFDSYAINIKDLHDIILPILKKDPYFFLQ